MDIWLTIIISSVAVCEQIDHNIILAIIYYIPPVAKNAHLTNHWPPKSQINSRSSCLIKSVHI